MSTTVLDARRIVAGIFDVGRTRGVSDTIEVFVAVGVGTPEEPSESVPLGVFTSREGAEDLCRSESTRLQDARGDDDDHNAYYVHSGVIGRKLTGGARRVVGIGRHDEYLSKNGM